MSRRLFYLFFTETSVQFAGLQKLSLVDYPAKTAATLFTQGCNFACPFCHNSSLISHDFTCPKISAKEALQFLKKRTGLLDAVVISGGEPLLHNSLKSFLREVKDLGYLIKIDTNASKPKALKNLVELGLVDYIAMDIKSDIVGYPEASGTSYKTQSSIQKLIQESVDFLLNSSIDYEFRTTVVKGIHTKEQLAELAKRIQGAKSYYLQNFENSSGVAHSNLASFSAEEMQEFLSIVQKHVSNACIRQA